MSILPLKKLDVRVAPVFNAFNRYRNSRHREFLATPMQPSGILPGQAEPHIS